MDVVLSKASLVRANFPDGKLIFVSGNFNVIHPGHLRLLNFAKSCGETLIVGLFPDTSPGVLVGIEDRRSGLIALECVDDVVSLEIGEIFAFIRALKPGLVIKGKEHEFSENVEHEAVMEYGGRLIFGAGESTFSSRDLLRWEIENPMRAPLRADTDFLQRRSVSSESLRRCLNRFSSLRVCVLGDLILDEYVYCEALGMSQEDPTIVVTPFENKLFLGGAGIVASHLVGLGAKTSFFSIVGADRMANAAEEMLAQYGVEFRFVVDSSRPTTLKQRFRAGNKTLLRVSHLRSHDVEKEHQIEILHRLALILKQVDGVIFSDFNYGCLPQSLVDDAIELCRRAGVPFVADSQASSQVGDVSRYRKADLICATEREARLAMNDFRSGLQHIANALLSKSEARHVLVKLGPEGLLALTRQPDFLTDDLPAFNSNPVDVAGAGDAMLAAATLVRLAGGSIWESAYMGSLAAAIQVSRMGNIPLSIKNLQHELASM